MEGKTKNDAIEFLCGVAAEHTPSNARRYSYRVMTDGAAIANAFGFQVDLKPAEGKVVAINDNWVVVKTARTEFFVALRDLLRAIPEIGETVCITPYHRRRFDGKLIGTPDESVSGGLRCSTIILGDSSSRIPLDVSTLKSGYLKEMVNQVDKMPAGDGIRNIANALVDAGGDSPALLSYQDPEDEDCIATPPSLEFAINTKKFQGSLFIEYDRAMDYYNVFLKSGGMVMSRHENVDFTSLGQVVLDLVDDGEWKFAKVEVLKKAPKKKAA